jgi:cysteine synthase B
MTKFEEILRDNRLLSIPMVKVKSLSDKHVTVWLKKEWEEPNSNDPLRSVKRKPAYFLFYEELERTQLSQVNLRENGIMISATSGNFGIEVGIRAMLEGYKFICVVPSSVPEYNLEVMLGLGIDVIQTAEEKTCPREQTVFLVRQYVTEEPNCLYMNIDQYYSFLNPISQIVTAKEIFGELKKVDNIICAVGSCGTISGIRQYIWANDYKTKVIGVQPAPDQGIPGAHIVKGDCKWSPENYSAIISGKDIYDADWVDSFAFTTLLWGEGINAGPSTGMALSHAYKTIREGAKGTIVVISADSHFKYEDLLFERLNETKEGILERYPELRLETTIEDYTNYLGEKGIDWIEERISESYGPSKRGKVFHVKYFEEIGLGRIPLQVGEVRLQKTQTLTKL